MPIRENLKQHHDQDSREFRKMMLTHIRAVLSDRPEHQLPLLMSGNGVKMTKSSEPTTAKALIYEKGGTLPNTADIHPEVSAWFTPHGEGKPTASVQVICSIPDTDIERLGHPIHSVDQIPAVRGTITRLMGMAGIGENPLKTVQLEIDGKYPERTVDDFRIMQDVIGKNEESEPHFCHTRFALDFDLRSKDQLLAATEVLLKELDKAPEKRR